MLFGLVAIIFAFGVAQTTGLIIQVSIILSSKWYINHFMVILVVVAFVSMKCLVKPADPLLLAHTK